MNIKTDENIGATAIAFLREHGHDVATVREQGLGGASDEEIFRICTSEQRVLVTLDRDFGQVTRFPPHVGSGIVILELGGPGSLSLMRSRLKDFLALAATRNVDRELWIVEPSRVRVHLHKDRD